MEFRDNQAIYLQIADHIIENILLKKWPKGERIPSVREMAVQLEVNPNTVARTYNFLQEKEIIFNKRGIGYFVAENGLERAKAAKREEFIKYDVPAFFQKMELLEMTLDEVYEKYKNKSN